MRCIFFVLMQQLLSKLNYKEGLEEDLLAKRYHCSAS